MLKTNFKCCLSEILNTNFANHTAHLTLLTKRKYDDAILTVYSLKSRQYSKKSSDISVIYSSENLISERTHVYSFEKLNITKLISNSHERIKVGIDNNF